LGLKSHQLVGRPKKDLKQISICGVLKLWFIKHVALQENILAVPGSDKPESESAVMKRNRAWLALGVFVALVFVATLAVRGHFQTRYASAAVSPKLIAAVQAFSRDLLAQGRPTPESVTLSELVMGGYIANRDIRAFDGMDVTISLTADGARPQQIMIRVRKPGLSQAALFS
jgi:hypothetical protein